jgi:ribonucleotide reductase beta subunit family protein with ferritin-like domain
MLYDKLGFTKDVTAFIEYNANKAFDNLGLEKIFIVNFDLPLHIEILLIFLFYRGFKLLVCK